MKRVSQFIPSLCLTALCLFRPFPADADRLSSRYDFPQIIDLSQTPTGRAHQTQLFADMGTWMGFGVRSTPSSAFRGPYSILQRRWLAEAVIAPAVNDNAECKANYFPGELTLQGSAFRQSLIYTDAHTALLTISGKLPRGMCWQALRPAADARFSRHGSSVLLSFKGGEQVMLTFPKDFQLEVKGQNYSATLRRRVPRTHVVISFIWDQTATAEIQFAKAERLLKAPEAALQENLNRWNGWLKRIIRQDMPAVYDRIAAKTVVTLVSNWRRKRGGLRHDGIIPSHSVDYFIGCWAWDSWRFSAAVASFFPSLAKDNVRVMFDWQQPDGMVIDCIYPDTMENNSRNSKPPLAAWAVDEIWKHTHDKDFLHEMLPKLTAYYRWWYEQRDHDHNGICEFGSTDGTLEAAAWESGMDNAIRFDGAEMVRNGKNAWSINQESVDLNGYLALEYTLLKKFAAILGQRFDMPDQRQKIADWFFDDSTGWFCDRKLADRSFVREPGCEGYLPFWVGIASTGQFTKARALLEDPAKFSTFIPFPTIAADNPKYSANGYWRGPIWLDQTYYGIEAFREYGLADEADHYTRQVFDRLQGLTGTAPIYENYDTFTGRGLQAAHFSWSAAHLLLLYEDYGKKKKRLLFPPKALNNDESSKHHEK